MVYLLILLMITFCGVIISQFLLKTEATSPLSIHSVIWFLVIVTGIIVSAEFIDFPEESFYAFLIWYLTLYVSLFLGEISLSSKKNGNNYLHNGMEIVCAQYWKLVIPACMYTAYEIYNVGINGPDSFFLNLRLANTLEDYSGPTFTVMPILYPIIMSMFVVNLFARRQKLNDMSLLAWVILFGIGTMGKFAIVTPALAYLIIREFKFGISRKKLLLTVPIILVGILALHFTRMSANDNSTINLILGTYIYSPLLAFSTINPATNNDFGEYCFRFVYAVFNKIGLIGEEPVKTLLDYAYVPTPTNVFTVMQPFYQDFSYPGIFIGALIYGLFFSLLYRFTKKYSICSLLVYSLLSISLLTSFFAETLVTNLSGNIKLAIITILIYRFTTKWKIKQ